jgi:hypothetical protein
MSRIGDKFLREWCGRVYHILVNEGVIITSKIPATLQSEFEAKFPGRGHSFNVEIDGNKMVIGLGVSMGTIAYTHHIEYTHHTEVDKRTVTQFPTSTVKPL